MLKHKNDTLTINIEIRKNKIIITKEFPILKIKKEDQTIEWVELFNSISQMTH